MAGGDAFFEEGIHWLHIAGSLGPRITAIHGYRPSVSREGPDRRAKSMMVAFRYDNGAVGSLYYSREIPSLFRGLRLSKLFGRDGVITFESNGVVLVARGRGLPRLCFPGFADIRGYQAMYRDFRRAIATGSAPEMSLERAMDDQRLMDQVYATLETAVTEPFDIIIIGSGAGGGTMAHALSPTGARILILERGDFVPQEDGELEPGRRSGRTSATGRPSAGSTTHGREFQPYTHYSVGGNTKFWGSVLYRLRREDFQAVQHADGVSPAWPIDYETLAPYYDRAERLYQRARRGRRRSDRAAARPVSVSPRCRTRRGWREIVEQLRAQGLHPSPLPLGLLRPGEPDGCMLCNTCNSFPCRIHAKSDADVCASDRRLRAPNVTLWTRRLRPPPDHRSVGREESMAVEVERNGAAVRVEAPTRRRVVRRRELRGAAAAVRDRHSIPTASRTRPASSAAATWRTSRR